MAVINQITQGRLFRGVFVCMKCNSKIRTDSLKVKAGKVKCRKCGYKGLRPKNRTVKAKS